MQDIFLLHHSWPPNPCQFCSGAGWGWFPLNYQEQVLELP